MVASFKEMPMPEVDFSLSIEARDGSVAVDPRCEIPRLLRAVAESIERGRNGATLIDKAKDEIGSWELLIEDAEDESDDSDR